MVKKHSEKVKAKMAERAEKKEGRQKDRAESKSARQSDKAEEKVGRQEDRAEKKADRQGLDSTPTIESVARKLTGGTDVEGPPPEELGLPADEGSDTWSGAGEYTYSMKPGSDDIEVTDKDGRTTYAKPMTDAFTAILNERHGDPMLGGAPAPEGYVDQGPPMPDPMDAPAPEGYMEQGPPMPDPMDAPAPEGYVDQGPPMTAPMEEPAPEGYVDQGPPVPGPMVDFEAESQGQAERFAGENPEAPLSPYQRAAYAAEPNLAPEGYAPPVPEAPAAPADLGSKVGYMAPGDQEDLIMGTQSLPDAPETVVEGPIPASAEAPTAPLGESVDPMMKLEAMGKVSEALRVSGMDPGSIQALLAALGVTPPEPIVGTGPGDFSEPV